MSTPSREYNAALSPDGRWLAYESDRSGQDEIYVSPFPDVTAWSRQVSNAGGSTPLWAPDGRELFYVSGDRLMGVPVQTVDEFSYESPAVVFDEAYYFGNYHRNYDIGSDGRFLMIKDVGQATTPAQIVVVENWTRELLERVPVN